MNQNFKKTCVALAGLLLVGFVAEARGHFPWLAVDDEGHAVYFFGENLADRTYHLPEPIAAAKVSHTQANKPARDVQLEAVDTDSLVGKRSKKEVVGGGHLYAQATYGNYHGTKLTYYTQLFVGSDSTHWSTKPNGSRKLEAVLTERDGGIAAQIFCDGKPLADAKVQLFGADGQEESVATTDGKGRVQFAANNVQDGLNGLLVGHVVKDAPGTFNGEPYTGEAHYLTVTFTK